jgi:hypothetical protein
MGRKFPAIFAGNSSESLSKNSGLRNADPQRNAQNQKNPCSFPASREFGPAARPVSGDCVHHQPPSDFMEVSTVDGFGPGNARLWSESRKIRSLGGWKTALRVEIRRSVSGDGFCVSQSRLSTLRQRLRFERVRAVRSSASGDFCGGSSPSRPPVRRGLRSAHRRSLSQGCAARAI